MLNVNKCVPTNTIWQKDKLQNVSLTLFVIHLVRVTKEVGQKKGVCERYETCKNKQKTIVYLEIKKQTKNTKPMCACDFLTERQATYY